MNRVLSLLFLSVIAVTLLVSQSTNIPPDIDKAGRTITPRPMPHLIYTPADLAHNAVTLPVSGTMAASSVVNMGAVTKSTLFVNCTQVVNVQVNTYREDGVTIDGTYTIVQNMPAGAQQVYIASELQPFATGGTISTNVRLPQRAFSFQEQNTTASAGTCTDRFVVGTRAKKRFEFQVSGFGQARADQSSRPAILLEMGFGET